MQQTTISHRVCVDYPRALPHDTPLSASQVVSRQCFLLVTANLQKRTFFGWLFLFKLSRLIHKMNREKKELGRDVIPNYIPSVL